MPCLAVSTLLSCFLLTKLSLTLGYRVSKLQTIIVYFNVLSHEFDIVTQGLYFRYIPSQLSYIANSYNAYSSLNNVSVVRKKIRVFFYMA